MINDYMECVIYLFILMNHGRCYLFIFIFFFDETWNVLFKTYELWESDRLVSIVNAKL